MSKSSASFLAAAGTKALQSAPHVAEGARVALMPAAQGAAFVAKVCLASVSTRTVCHGPDLHLIDLPESLLSY